jgi:hypothetical protein
MPTGIQGDGATCLPSSTDLGDTGANVLASRNSLG